MQRMHLLLPLCVALLLSLDAASANLVPEFFDSIHRPPHQSIKSMIARLNPHGLPIALPAKTDEKADGCASDPQFPIGKQTVITIPTQDGDRNFIIYVPNSYIDIRARNRTGDVKEYGYNPAALQVMFHGLNDNCQHFLDATGFIQHAEKDGYILVSACGSRGLLGTGWNSGMCCGFFSDRPDDIGFARSIVEVVSARVCVDPSKVMAVGLSNGAMHAEILGCTAPDVFRAVASVSGVVELRPGNAQAISKCDSVITEKGNAPLKRPSVLMIHGDRDSTVPWDGNSFLGFPDMPSNIAGWVRRNGCDANSPRTTINTTTYHNSIYEKCKVEEEGEKVAWLSEVEIMQVIGGGHNWPHDDELTATEYIYEFGRRVFGSY